MAGPPFLLDLLVEGVALQPGIILLLLDALGDRLLVALGEIARDGFALFAGFGALECDGFLHGLNGLEAGAKPCPHPVQPKSNAASCGLLLLAAVLGACLQAIHGVNRWRAL